MKLSKRYLWLLLVLPVFFLAFKISCYTVPPMKRWHAQRFMDRTQREAEVLWSRAKVLGVAQHAPPAHAKSGLMEDFDYWAGTATAREMLNHEETIRRDIADLRRFVRESGSFK